MFLTKKRCVKKTTMRTGTIMMMAAAVISSNVYGPCKKILNYRLERLG